MNAEIGAQIPVTLTVVSVGPAYLGASYDMALCTFVAPNGETVQMTLDPKYLGGAA